MFEIELTICIKMDLALNNLHRLICHKFQRTNQLNMNIRFMFVNQLHSWPVSWSCRIHLSRGLRPNPSTNALDTAQSCIWWWGSSCRAWGKCNTPSLPFFPDPFWREVILTDRIQSLGQTERFNNFLYLKAFNYIQPNDWY